MPKLTISVEKTYQHTNCRNAILLKTEGDMKDKLDRIKEREK